MITHHDMCVDQHLSQNQYHKSSNNFQQYLHNFDCIQKFLLYIHQFLSSDNYYMNIGFCRFSLVHIPTIASPIIRGQPVPSITRTVVCSM